MSAMLKVSTFIQEPNVFATWLNDQMELAPPFYFLSRELNERCDQFLVDLRSGQPITFAPLTKNTVSRALRSEPPLDDKRCRRSKVMLHYLAVIGTSIERQSHPVTYTVGDLISHAITAWPEHAERLVVTCGSGQEGRNRSYHAYSKPRAITEPEILISVPFVAPGARLRFRNEDYLRGLPVASKAI